MPARVTYWTGIWRPGLEAVSNEVIALRRALAPGSPIVSFSTGQRSHVDWRHRAVCLSGRRWLALRALATVVEPLGRLTHAWGAVSDWHFPRALHRRPVVFTVAFGGAPYPAPHYDAVHTFAVEAEPLAKVLEASGIASSRIRIVYPGVDLRVFTPGAVPSGRFQLLFASAPADPGELANRGVALLVETARACPDIDVVLLWREWGSAGTAARALAALDPPANVRVVHRGERTMAEVYRAAHAVACIYADGFGKTTPNSVVEGLACGRPAVVARSCGIAGLLTSEGAGHATAFSVGEVVAAVRDLQQEWPAYSVRARELAARSFGLEQFVAAYARIYSNILD